MLSKNGLSADIDIACDSKQTEIIFKTLDLLKLADNKIHAYLISQTFTIKCSTQDYKKEPGAYASHDVKSFLTILYPPFWKLDLLSMAATLAHEARHNEHHFYDHVSCNRVKGSDTFEGCDQSFEDYGAYRVTYEVYKAFSKLETLTQEQRASADLKSQIIFNTSFNDQADNKGKGVYTFWGKKAKRFFHLKIEPDHTFSKSDFFAEIEIPRNAKIFPIDIKGNEQSEVAIVDRDEFLLYEPVVSQGFSLTLKIQLPGQFVGFLDKNLLIQEPDSLNLYELDFKTSTLKFIQSRLRYSEIKKPKILNLNQAYLIDQDWREFYYYILESKKTIFHRSLFAYFQVQNINWDEYDDVIIFEKNQLTLYFGTHENLQKTTDINISNFDQVVLLKHFEPIEGVHFKK